MTKRILLVDDSRADYLLTEGMLHDIGRDEFKLHWVDCIEAGLQQLSSPDNFDLLLLDYHIGPDTAIEMLERMGESRLAIPIIVLTGVYDLAKDLAVAELGVMDFLEKDHLDSRLLERSIRYSLSNYHKAQIERQLVRVQEELIQAEKMASIGQFAAGIAHEINNPAGFVCSNMSTLGKILEELTEYLDDLKVACSSLPEGEAKSNITRIFGQVEKSGALDDIRDIAAESLEGMNRIRSIVSDLKQFSHTSAKPTYKEADINQAIRSTLNIIHNEIKYDADTDLDFADLPSVICDVGRINQVIMNILINAVHAIKKRHDGGRGLIRVRTSSAGEAVVIEITDNGCGIPAEMQKQIFEPFFTTKEIGKGTGLGLSIAYGIIKDHAGEISVESKEGEGAHFRIKLPVEHR